MNRICLSAIFLASFVVCNKAGEAPEARSYAMGFMNSAPRYDDFNLVLQSLARWTQRADCGYHLMKLHGIPCWPVRPSKKLCTE